MRKKVKSLPGSRDLSHSAGMMRLRKAPWLSNSALPLAPAQVASVNPVARAWAGKYLPIRSPSTWNDLTIRGSSQPISPRARSLKASAPATRRMTGSVHLVSGQPSLPPTASGATPSAFRLVHGRGELGPGGRHADPELLELLRGVPDERVDVALEVHGVRLAIRAGGDLPERVGVGAVLDPGIPLPRPGSAEGPARRRSGRSRAAPPRRPVESRPRTAG